MFFSGLIILGFVSLKDLNIRLFPEMDYPALSIVMELNEINTERAEKEIVEVAEKYLSSISGVRDIVSLISTNGAEITLYFDWGENMDVAYVKTKERVLDLERELRGKIRKIRIKELGPLSKPFMGILFPDSLKDFVRDEVASRINTLNGIGRTAVVYYKPGSYNLTVSPLHLVNLPFSVTEFVKFLKFSGIASRLTGYVKAGSRILPATIGSPFKDISDISNLELGNIRLNRISTVEEGRVVMSAWKGYERVCLLFVFPSGKGSTLRASKKIRQILDEYGIDHKILFDKSAIIKKSIDGLLFALILGIFLSWGILFFFLKNPFTAFTVGLSIPVSLISSFFVFKIFHIDLNLITIGGLIVAAGMLVDSSIVVVESISRFWSSGPMEAAIRGTDEVKSPVIASILTNCAVFVPAMFISGFPGLILRPFSIVVVGSLLISLLVALTLVPAGVSVLGRGRMVSKIDGFSEKTASLTGWFIFKKKSVFPVIFLLLSASLCSFRFLKIDPLPLQKTGNVKFRITPHQEVRESEFLRKLSLLGTDFLVVHNRAGEEYFDVYFQGIQNYDSLMKSLEEIFPGFYMEMEEFDNPEEDLKSRVYRVPREYQREMVSIRLDLKKIVAFGIPVSDIQFALKSSIGGVKLFDINGNPVFFRVPADRLKDLLILPVRRDSIVYKLGEFIKIEENAIPGIILRQNGRRVKEIELERAGGARDLIIALFVSIVLVYLVIAAQYNSLSLPLLVMLAVPLSFVPVPLVLILLGESLNPLSIMGIIVLGGISVNNAIILLDYTRRLVAANEKSPLILAVKRRFRSMVMTSLTTILALTPLALGIGPGGQMESSMAHVLIAGLIFATFSSLFILPPVYDAFFKS